MWRGYGRRQDPLMMLERMEVVSLQKLTRMQSPETELIGVALFPLSDRFHLVLRINKSYLVPTVPARTALSGRNG